MIRLTNKIIHLFLTGEDLEENYYVKDYLKNNYLKQNFKRISNSYNVISTDSKNIKNFMINTVKPSVNIWIYHILNYEQGLNFLKDENQTDKDWAELLSKRKDLNENESPFVKIKKEEIWNW